MIKVNLNVIISVAAELSFKCHREGGAFKQFLLAVYDNAGTPSTASERKNLISLLREYVDVFAKS